MTHRLTLPLAAALLAVIPLCAGAAAPSAKPAAPKSKAAAMKPKGAAAKPRPIKLATVPAGAKAMMVAFGAGARFIDNRPMGGLDASGKSANAAQTFQLLDLNGGALQDGDKVQIAMAGAGRPSFWQEDKGKIHRTGGHPDATCVFVVKWKKKDTSLTLQTASKQYVAAPASGGALVTTTKASDPTTVLTLIKKG